MVWAATAITVGAGLVGSRMQSRAAERAAESASSAQIAGAEAGAEAQLRAAELGIEEQRRQFDEVRRILAPYIQAGDLQLTQFAPFQRAGLEEISTLQEFAAVGPEALQQQRALAGLAGPQAQQAAISQIEGSPQFRSLARQGEEALLQQASATGGLRGGNVQAALAQFRPQLLNQLIEQQYGRLGGLMGAGGAATERLFTSGLGSQELLARLGQASATGQAAGATSLGSGISSALGNIGAAQAAAAQTAGAARAGAALAGGTSPVGQFLSAVPSMAGTYYGMTGRSPFSGLFGGSPTSATGQVYSGGGSVQPSLGPWQQYDAFGSPQYYTPPGAF